MCSDAVAGTQWHFVKQGIGKSKWHVGSGMEQATRRCACYRHRAILQQAIRFLSFPSPASSLSKCTCWHASPSKALAEDHSRSPVVRHGPTPLGGLPTVPSQSVPAVLQATFQSKPLSRSPFDSPSIACPDPPTHLCGDDQRQHPPEPLAGLRGHAGVPPAEDGDKKRQGQLNLLSPGLAWQCPAAVPTAGRECGMHAALQGVPPAQRGTHRGWRQPEPAAALWACNALRTQCCAGRLTRAVHKHQEHGEPYMNRGSSSQCYHIAAATSTFHDTLHAPASRPLHPVVPRPPGQGQAHDVAHTRSQRLSVSARVTLQYTVSNPGCPRKPQLLLVRRPPGQRRVHDLAHERQQPLAAVGQHAVAAAVGRHGARVAVLGQHGGQGRPEQQRAHAAAEPPDAAVRKRVYEQGLRGRGRRRHVVCRTRGCAVLTAHMKLELGKPAVSRPVSVPHRSLSQGASAAGSRVLAPAPCAARCRGQTSG